MEGNYQCPRRLFSLQLIAQLTELREDGENLTLLIDANENMETCQLSKLFSVPALRMREVLKRRSQIPGPPSFIRGSRQIDGAWVTDGLEIAIACFLPFNFGLGDYRDILLDIPQVSFLGNALKTIERSVGRRLQCTNDLVMNK